MLKRLIDSGPTLDSSEASRVERDHSPRAALHVEPADVLPVAAVRRLRLDDYPENPAELVEVVDVERAEVGLERAKDIADRNPQGLRLLAVDFEPAAAAHLPGRC